MVPLGHSNQNGKLYFAKFAQLVLPSAREKKCMLKTSFKGAQKADQMHRLMFLLSKKILMGITNLTIRSSSSSCSLSMLQKSFSSLNDVKAAFKRDDYTGLAMFLNLSFSES